MFCSSVQLNKLVDSQASSGNDGRCRFPGVTVNVGVSLPYDQFYRSKLRRLVYVMAMILPTISVPLSSSSRLNRPREVLRWCKQADASLGSSMSMLTFLTPVFAHALLCPTVYKEMHQPTTQCASAPSLQPGIFASSYPQCLHSPCLSSS